MTLGEWIKHYRFTHGMSQRDFADRVPEISKSQIAAVETGRIKAPSYKTFAAIAKACGLTPNELATQCSDTPVANTEELTEREDLSATVNSLSDEQVHNLLKLLKGFMR